jgi:hypothetical protein
VLEPDDEPVPVRDNARRGRCPPSEDVVGADDVRDKPASTAGDFIFGSSSRSIAREKLRAFNFARLLN